MTACNALKVISALLVHPNQKPAHQDLTADLSQLLIKIINARKENMQLSSMPKLMLFVRVALRVNIALNLALLYQLSAL